MSVEGVRRARHQVVAKGAADLSAHGSDLGVESLRVLPRAELCRAVGPPVEALLRHGGVELEGTPANIETELITQEPAGLLHPAFADEAPGTNDVRDDLDG